MKHSISLSLLSILSISLAAATPALAKDIPGPAGSNCVVYAPDGWKLTGTEKGGEGVMAAASPDDSAAILWALANAANTDKAIKALDTIIAKVVPDAKRDNVKKTTLNGMKAIAIGASGTHDGKPVSIGIVIVEPAKGKYLFTIGMVETSKKAMYKDESYKVLAGIRRTR